MTGIILKVIEARTKDVGRGIARIDPKIMNKYKLEPGELITITGKKKTVAILHPPYPEDYDSESIRLDSSIRKNADTGLDEKVKIHAIEGKYAEKVIFSLTEKLRLIGGEEYIGHMMEGRAVTKGDVVEINVMGRKIALVVSSYTPSAEAVIIRYNTIIEISEKPLLAKETKVPSITYDDIGGMSEEVRKVREMIELPLRHPEVFERLGVEAPKGVLLHGPPGTGKTLLAKAVANETQANFFTLSGPEIMSKFYGQSEENLRQIFEEAEKNSPSIIFIDELDSIAPKRDEVTGEVEKRVVAQLLTLMDGLKSRGKVVVIGATNRVNALDPAIRRPGRFDREIEIRIPDRNARHEILQIHTRGMPLAKDVDLPKLADMTHGYVGADLAALAKEAAMRALRRIIPKIDLDSDTIPREILNQLQVTYTDFLDAYRELVPSTMREVFVETPSVKWNDIGGLETAKQELKEAVEWPLKYGKLFTHMNAKPSKGILLYGPPGTGKTLLAKAVATESEANFISIKGPEVLSKWVGESERAIRDIFRKARQAAPCVIFFDEIDSIAPIRGSSHGDAHVTERIISQLLTELDGLEELRNVIVIGATNRPDIVDTALLRPGRFDRHIYIPLPDKKARLEILKIHTKNVPMHEDIDLEKIAEHLENFTGADIALLAQRTIMQAIREYILAGGKVDEDSIKYVKLYKKHFDEALNSIRARTKEDLKHFEEISKKFRESSIYA